ncbi:MAG TPA: hypothetical protein VGL21_10415 [Jatrophihabitantaceae bacterium]|jgi:hypothetical protein
MPTTRKGVGAAGHTASVRGAISGRWDHGAAIDAATVSQVNAKFWTSDDSVCVWVDGRRPSVLCVSIDVAANTDDEAIAEGRSALDEAVRTVSLTGDPVEIVAMTDTGMITWSP